MSETLRETHVLIADKDPNICELVSTRLSNRGFRVTCTDTMEELLRILDRDPPALILVSSDMGRVSGRHPVEKIREKAHLSAVPVILLTRESEIAELILGQDRGFDDFLIKPFSPLILQLRVALNMSRARARTDANALTHLPGNAAIEKKIMGLIGRGEKFSVLYIDINQFKAFNDRYSFEKGDDVLKHTAKLLLQTREKVDGLADCFVGHIGGDDFIVVLPPDHEESFARTFIREFDRVMPSYYNDADRSRGYIRATNRRGKKENIPLMSCSVAACNNLYRPYKNLGEIARDAAEVKSFLKSQTGSHYLRDRRSEPIAQIEKAFEILSPEVAAHSNPSRDGEPLGRLLVNAGLLTEEQLEAAIKRHLETRQKLGQTLIAMQLVSAEEIGRILQKKLHISYVHLAKARISEEALRIFSPEFMRTYRIVPVSVTGSQLKVAMCDPFDIKTLDAVERASRLKPLPCLTLEDEFDSFMRHHTSSGTADSMRTGSYF